MRKLVWLVLSLALALTVLAAMPVAAEANGAKDPFTGAWKAIDGDGSAMTLAISGGGAKRHITWFDQYWNCQSCDPPGYYPTVALGTGVVEGDEIEAMLRWHDAPPGYWNEAVPYSGSAQSDGTLLFGGFTWERAGS